MIDDIVLVGLVTACLFAGSPTFLSPSLMNPMIEGVVLFPSEFAITTGSLPSITETHEFVVPKSIPIIFPIVLISFVKVYMFIFNVSSTTHILSKLYQNKKPDTITR